MFGDQYAASVTRCSMAGWSSPPYDTIGGCYEGLPSTRIQAPVKQLWPQCVYQNTSLETFMDRCRGAYAVLTNSAHAMLWALVAHVRPVDCNPDGVQADDYPVH